MSNRPKRRPSGIQFPAPRERTKPGYLPNWPPPHRVQTNRLQVQLSSGEWTDVLGIRDGSLGFVSEAE